MAKINTEQGIRKFIGDKRIDYDALTKNIDMRVFWRLLKNKIANFDEATRTYGIK